MPGRFMTAPVIATQKRDWPTPRRPVAEIGTRPFSTRSPSQLQHRRQDRERGEDRHGDDEDRSPSANGMNDLSPLINIPAIAATTVAPEISTARPEVAAAA